MLKTGKFHPLNECIYKISKTLRNLGFIEIYGPEILTTDQAFSSLNIPKDHPSRDMKDTFYISQDLTLASHATSVMYSQIINFKPPFKVFCTSAVHRNDDEDSTHTTTFYQTDVLVADTNITFSHVKNLTTNLLRMFNFQNIDFVPGDFPFTDPSAELYVDNTEIIGCGLLVDHVKKALNINNYQCLAAGIGVNRIASKLYNIHDIRSFYSANYRRY